MSRVLLSTRNIDCKSGLQMPWASLNHLCVLMALFKAGEVKMQYERGVVEGIELGQAYAVRIRARNAAGVGQWSLESDQLVCKHKALKPKVIIDAPKELTIKEGETFTVFANIEGEPVPDNAKWLISDRELSDEPGTGIIVDNKKPHK